MAFKKCLNRKEERVNRRRKYGLCATTIVCSWLSFPVSAQVVMENTAAPVLLTLPEAVKKAVDWHPSIDVAVGELNQGKAQVQVARAGYRPQLSGGVLPGLEIYNGVRWQPQAQISASQMLYDFGKVSAAVASTQAAVQVNRAQLLGAVDTLVRDTAYAVIETQRYKALLIVAQDQLKAVQDITGLVEQRAEKGASTRSDAVQAEARVEDAQTTILQISSELVRWRSTLAHMVGTRDLPDVTTDVPDWYGSLCVHMAPDWTEMPQVLEYEARKNEAIADLEEARARGRPTVAFQVTGESYLRSPFTGRSDITAGINVSTNVFDGGATRARREAASYALRAADAALDNARNDASRDLDEARSQIGGLSEALNVLASRRDNMEETSRLYKAQYFQLGTRTLIDLLNSEQELHQARFDFVNRDHDIRRLNQDCLYSGGRTRDAFALSGMTIRGITL
jgi:adhesin transport system outer membrane protein